MSAPFPNVRFIPTGGITTNNVKEYLSSSAVFAVGGSWMVPQKAIDAGEFHQLSALIREARELCAQ
jgi:2-dehydro-3-deoxyphosphogluconate aldolase/(4S)-4-hydroxy-2-oxoglutarate aldolase